MPKRPNKQPGRHKLQRSIAFFIPDTASDKTHSDFDYSTTESNNSIPKPNQKPVHTHTKQSPLGIVIESAEERQQRRKYLDIVGQCYNDESDPKNSLPPDPQNTLPPDPQNTLPPDPQNTLSTEHNTAANEPIINIISPSAYPQTTPGGNKNRSTTSGGNDNRSGTSRIFTPTPPPQDTDQPQHPFFLPESARFMQDKSAGFMKNEEDRRINSPRNNPTSYKEI